jgi:carboxymethylenebutenolidase
MRGLAPFYEQLTLRLAERGHAAVAIDYYGRTAGTTPRTEQFPFMQHIMQVTAKTIGEDIMAAIQHLRIPAGGNCRKVLALGFCFGGRQAILASAARFTLAGVIGFYGALSFYPNGAPGPLQRVSELCAPILGIFGGADGGISVSDVATFDEALTVSGIEHEIVTYPHAPHGFFDIKFKEHETACTDAWRRVLAFIAAHSN